MEDEIDDDQWVKTQLEKLSLIDEKRLTSIYYGQLYQKRMARAYNKKVRHRHFKASQLVLRCILPHPIEAKGKFSPNWQGPFMVKKVLPNGVLYLTDAEGQKKEYRSMLMRSKDIMYDINVQLCYVCFVLIF